MNALSSRPPPVYALRFEVALDHADACEARLEVLGFDVNIDYDYVRRRAAFLFHLPTRAQADARAAALTQWLCEPGGCDGGPLERYLVPGEDWSESWKKHFHATRVSRRIIVKPSWENPEHLAARPGDMAIEIDPGMSFGTGRHFTTVSCLALLDEVVPVPCNGRFLDVGCGSGILAIGACKLGYRTVTAFDNDPLAVHIARENFHKNNIAVAPDAEGGAPVARCLVLDLAQSPILRDYDTVVANMLAPLLIEHAPLIADAVTRRPGGFLILAGLLREQSPAVLRAYAERGFTEIVRKEDGEWCTLGLQAVRTPNLSAEIENGRFPVDGPGDSCLCSE